MDTFVVIIAMLYTVAVAAILAREVYCLMYIKLKVKPTLVQDGNTITITTKDRFYNRKYVADLSDFIRYDSVFVMSRGWFVEWHKAMIERGWKPV